MLSTVTKRAFIAAFLFAFCTAVSAGEKPPRYLNEPLLGLRLDAKVKLDPLPDEVRAKCPRIADDDESSVHLWIFAQASDAGAAYYVASGYTKMRHPASGAPLYDPIVRGGLYIIAGNKCDDDPADESFGARDFNITPLPILKQLSRDLAVRLVRAVGSADKLRAEIKNQRIDFDSLSPELQEAFRPYFPATTK
jgi:hypothetical protein